MSVRVIINANTAAPVEIDEDGHLAYPGDWIAVVDNPVLESAISMGLVVDRTDQVTEKSTPAAWAALQTGIAKATAGKPVADPRPTDTMSVEGASSAAT